MGEECVGEYGLYYDPADHETQENEKSGEKGTPFFDINHTAPQHRQYLSNEGFGYGNPFQRQRQHQKYRAMKASESVTQHTVDKLSVKYENQLATTDKNAKKSKETSFQECYGKTR